MTRGRGTSGSSQLPVLVIVVAAAAPMADERPAGAWHPDTVGADLAACGIRVDRAPGQDHRA
uniref:Uncharacterized protein n=1 Tax=uncultured Nocardioidaceae bacterium TaxID=253824 RepID=A0A6J4L5D4_9ACTN|nr:MAG: hypothetical protein AVDCRST_MAG46-869 [uncultured Nocardioidaceae bacterium]